MLSITVLSVDVTPMSNTSNWYHNTVSASALATRKAATPVVNTQRCHVFIAVSFVSPVNQSLAVV